MESFDPIMIAAFHGDLKSLRTILRDRPESISLRDRESRTALHFAAAGKTSKSSDAIKLLLKKGADINAIDAWNRKPYDVAVKFDYKKGKCLLAGEFYGI